MLKIFSLSVLFVTKVVITYRYYTLGSNHNAQHLTVNDNTSILQNARHTTSNSCPHYYIRIISKSILATTLETFKRVETTHQKEIAAKALTIFYSDHSSLNLENHFIKTLTVQLS